LTENHDTGANISINVKTEYLLTKEKHRRDHIDYLNVAASTTDIHINNYDESSLSSARHFAHLRQSMDNITKEDKIIKFIRSLVTRHLEFMISFLGTSRQPTKLRFQNH
jgi:hypothetical protein